MRAAWMDLRGLMLSKRQRHGRFAYVYLMMLRSHEVVVVVKSLPHLVASLTRLNRCERHLCAVPMVKRVVSDLKTCLAILSKMESSTVGYLKLKCC